MRTAVFVCLALIVASLVIGCGSGSASTQSQTHTITPVELASRSASASPTLTPTPTASPTPIPTPTPVPTPSPEPTPTPTPSPSPTVSPTPIPVHHIPPYTIALEAGHGGPYYFGASTVDAAGNRVLEKDVNLDLAWRTHDVLVARGYNVVMVRTDDSTLTPFDPNDYRPSLIREAQARVDLANSSQADAYLALHFNGWTDQSKRGAEAYCDPDRSFGDDSCQLAWMVEQTIVYRMREHDYNVDDGGVKNDADVNGPAEVEHSWVLGTNPDFRPSLMPGAIIESLFLSNPDDLAFIERPDGLDVIANAIGDGVGYYFDWLNQQQ